MPEDTPAYPWQPTEQARAEAAAQPAPTQPQPFVPPPRQEAPIPAPPRRRRRVWVLAVAGLLVLGLAAGLLVWAPWNQPPAAPAAVVAASRTATSVAVSWSASHGGDTPDHYLVLRDGVQVASVPASQTSFTDNGLAPGTTHRYSIVAAAGGQRSGPSVKAKVTTITPSPVELADVKSTWTTATLRWQPSPLGPTPDQYEIGNGNGVVATVTGTTDSYDITGLTPGHSYQYEVVALWGSSASSPSAALTVSTLAPPLTGSTPLTVDTTSTPGPGASLSVGDHWSDTWIFTPGCSATACTLTADADLAAPGFVVREFTLRLHDSGGKYSGTTRAQISKCSSTSVTNTITLSIKPKGAVTNGAWGAWTGTMQVSSPYTTVGDEYCPSQSWNFAVTGNGGSPITA